MVFAQEFKQRLANGGELRYESGDIIQAPQETSDLPLCTGFWHLKDSLHFFGVYLYPFLAYNETKQFP
ncbi:hypothetical protein KH5H1_78760 [Corallococcus caeni]|nr:hypothetical protein KH5H1_78760 [Corallococcus sp. KH5-1]